MSTNPYNDILVELKTYISTNIDEVLVATIDDGNIQAVVDALYENQSDESVAGCLLDFLFAVPHAGDTRGPRDRWDIYVGGLGLLRFYGEDSTEDAKVQLISRFMGLFDGNTNKVFTNADKAQITRIDRPRKSKIGEHSFYFVPFTLKINYGGK